MGRERELAELLAALDDALIGRGRLVLLSGEPGIGKSRLADELTRHARDRALAVFAGRCWEAGGAPPYWPWVQLLRAYVRTRDPSAVRAQMATGASEIARMLPDVREMFPDVPPPPSSDPESARFRLFDSTTRFVQAAATEQPLVLFLEDLHAADTPSLLLLRFLAEQLFEMPAVVLATYRDVELTENESLSQTISELARQPITRRIRLRGLTEEDVRTYVEAATGREAESSLVATLHRQTNGNPLFLSESVRLLVSGGGLEPTSTSSLRLAVPAGIRDVIARRVRSLSQQCRDCLSLASVLGTEFPLEPLRRMAELPADDVLEVLDEATRAGVVVEIPGSLGRCRFSHDLVRESLYGELSPARRVRSHRVAAVVLENLFRNDLDDHLAEIAHHFFHAAPSGDHASAVHYATRAGDQAVRSLAYEEAARLYDMAVQALEMDEDPDLGTFGELLLSIGESQARAGDLPKARETFLRVASIARRTGAANQLARAALGYGGRFIWARAGTDPHLIAMLQDALVLLGGSDDAMRVRLMGRLACALRGSPDREHGAALSEQALQMARGLEDPSTLGYAISARCGAVWWPENPEERLALGGELIDLADRASDPELLVDAHLAMSIALFELCEVSDARSHLEQVARIAESLRQPARRWLSTAVRGGFALATGAFDEAEALIGEALRLNPTTPIADNVSAARFQLFLLRREQDRVGELEELIRRTGEEYPWYPVFRLALAGLLIDVGRVPEGRSLFEELAVDDLAGLNRDNYWLLCMALTAELCETLGDAVTAAVAYEKLRPFAGRNAIAQPDGSVGTVDRYLGLLCVATGEIDRAADHFGDAIEVNRRMGARPWVAHTQHDMGRTLLLRDAPGDRERAIELLTTCAENSRILGMIALERRVTSLLGSVGPPIRVPPSHGDASSTSASVFRREGEYYTVVFEGDAFRLRDSKGLRFLTVLLGSPGKEFHALDLVSMDAGPRGPTTDDAGDLPASGLGDAGDVLDERARNEFRQRLIELESEIEEAEAFGDAGRATATKEERDFLAHELAAAMGIGGRSRVVASAAERARVNVTRAIRSALVRVGEHSPALKRHLEATVRTGGFCSYTPDPGVRRTWQL